jgi:hypothetical protein
MHRPKISELFARPEFYLFGFDAGDALFLRMDRECYARSIFFDDRIVTLDDNLIRVPLAELVAADLPQQADDGGIGWIFHMAHTGSTLLARAMDRVGTTLVIREPMALRALGVEAGATRDGGAGAEHWHARLRLATAMLGRRFAPEERVVVKANVPVNAIIPELLAGSARPKAILLHFGLDDYLTAILRSPNHCKWTEHIFAEMRTGAVAEVAAAPPMQTAEKAAALWLFQMRGYAAALVANPGVRSLDANILFDEPLASLRAACAYFGSPMSEGAARRVVTGPLFSTYSKNPAAAFDNRLRKARIAETRAGIGDALQIARRWIAPRIAQWPLPDRLGQPLCGENRLLL